MKKMRKILALVLCLIMCLGMLPTWALAEDVTLMEERAAEMMQEEAEAGLQEQATEPEVPAEEPPVYEESAPEEAAEVVLPEPVDEVWPEETPDAAESAVAEELEVPPAEDNDSTESESAPVNTESIEPATEPDVQESAEPIEEKDAVPVQIAFVVTLKEAELFVYTKDEYDEKIIIDPEEDGSYLLLPGEYFYTLTAEGYISVEEEKLEVEPSEEPVKIEVALMPIQPEEGVENTEEATLQATEEVEETATLMAASGTCGDNLTWTLDDEGTLTISGSGEMRDYSVNGSYAPWYNSRSSIIKVVLESGVMSIGEYAFYECSNLTEVMIPETLTVINDNAFDSCSSLAGLVLPNGVSRIGVWAFWHCSSLTSITIPESVTGIGGGAFLDCTSLTSITVDSGNTKLISQDGVLFNKEQTTIICYPAGKPDTTYMIPEGVTAIGDSAFANCRFLSSVVFSESVKHIGNNSFEDATALVEVTFPSSMRTMYPNVFEGCTALESISIPEGIPEINSHMFYECTSLKTVTLPSSVIRIGEDVFYHCNSLTSIDVHPDNENFCSQDGVLFDKAKTTLLQYPVGKAEAAYSIPKGVTTITERAFENCTTLESLKIPNGVTRINKYAFNFCTSLKTVIIPVSVTDIGQAAFNGCSAITDVYYGGGDYEWGKISIGVYNSYLTRATFTYYYEDPADEELGNTAQSYSGEFHFRADEYGNMTAYCDYNDSFFDSSSWSYNHDLARMSLSMAMAAFTQGGTYGSDTHVNVEDYSKRDLLMLPPGNVVELMQNCGFTKIAVNEDYLLSTEYGDVNDGNNIGVCIGAKTLTEEGTYLIAVAVRGGGYGCEWIGNFNAYNPNQYPYHIGFNMAASEVVSQLRDYISMNGIVGKLKIWICGYSRGAATANLAAAKVADGALNGLGCTLDAADLFGYMFETPQGTKNSNAKAAQYNGIWNIINPVDPVTYVAMDDWGYTRYGHDMKLPSQYMIARQYRSYSDDVLDAFNSYKGSSYSSIPQMNNQYWEVIKLKNALPQFLGSDGTYRTSIFMSKIQNWFKGGSATSMEIASVVSYALDLFITEPILFAAGGAVIAGYAAYNEVWNVIVAHYPELILAWLNVIPSDMVTEDGFVRFAISNCPVDLAVYADGALQMRFVGDEVIYEDGAFIEGSIDADGQKVVCIPEDADVQIEIDATDDGEFNYSVQEYDVGTNQVTRVVNYYDVMIEEGNKLRAEVSNAAIGQYLLYGDDGGIIPADDELNGGSIAGYTVVANAEGEGTVIGGGYYITGEFAQVTATPNEGAVFQGWYNGDELLSQQSTYRFRPTGNMTLTARFQSGTAASGYSLSETEKTALPRTSFRLTIINSESGIPAVPSGTITWTSSNREIAAVNNNGVVTAKAVGTVTIHAQNENEDLSADCTVHVLFEDVADTGAYFYTPVYWAVGKGITSGTSATTFSPYNSCTRGQVMAFLYKAMGSPEVSSSNPFTDVKESDYFYKPVLWAVSQGITSGTSATTFSPYNPCTRAQVMSFLYKAMGSPEVSGSNPFTDVKESDYFYKPVLWAVSRGITNGTSATTFGPYNTCTRAQVMTFLYKAMN